MVLSASLSGGRQWPTTVSCSHLSQVDTPLNLITGFGTGITASATSRSNVFRENTIAYITQALDLMNDTNQDVDNVTVLLP